jgi:hypothetical protein
MTSRVWERLFEMDESEFHRISKWAEPTPPWTFPCLALRFFCFLRIEILKRCLVSKAFCDDYPSSVGAYLWLETRARASNAEAQTPTPLEVGLKAKDPCPIQRTSTTGIMKGSDVKPARVIRIDEAET